MPTYKYGGVSSGIGGGIGSGIDSYGISGGNEQSIQGAQGSSGLPTIQSRQGRAPDSRGQGLTGITSIPKYSSGAIGSSVMGAAGSSVLGG